MKAYIKRDTKKSEALWLIVERGKLPADVEKIMGMFRDEDDAENMAYPILEDEIDAIMQACIDWCVQRDLEETNNENK